MLLHTFDIVTVLWLKACIMMQQLHMQEYSVFVAIAILRVRTIYTYSDSSSHCVSYKTIQKVGLMLWISEVHALHMFVELCQGQYKDGTKYS